MSNHSSSWHSLLCTRSCSAEQAVLSALREGDQIVLGHAAAAPDELTRAMYEVRERLPRGLKIFHMIYLGEGWHLRPEMSEHLELVLNYLDANSRAAHAERRAHFLPCHFHEVPRLFTDGLYRVDVAMIMVSSPDADGYCSFGVSNDYTRTAAQCARTVVAVINPQMPYIAGDNLIHVSELDYIVHSDRPLVSVPCAPIGEVERRIAQHCASIIRDGDTLQLGIGAIPDAVLQCLDDKKDLGIHTEMFTDGVMHMLRSGHINGARKTTHQHKVVTTLVMGSQELYRFLDHNPQIESYPVSHTNDPYLIGQNDNMVSINSCIEIDLTGQVASESIGLTQFSGTGGQVDFLRGAKRSKGGRAILAFRSTAQGGALSRIVPMLGQGANVTDARTDVDYVATEWGIVRLRGLTLRERAEALCSIAHPDFRPMLQQAIQERFYS